MPSSSLFSRRELLRGAAGSPLLVATAAAHAAEPAIAGLMPLTANAAPITADERRGRLQRAQAQMARDHVDALLMEAGSTLEYFTGIRWHRSERTTAAVIPAHGDLFVVTPAFEEPSVRETLDVAGDVVPWNEDANPYELLVRGLHARRLDAGVVAVEPSTRFFIVDGLRRACHGCRMVSGDAIVRACRLIKSTAELALLQAANEVTLAALRFTHAHAEAGMQSADLARLMDAATTALGGSPEFSLVLLNQASAFPHGSSQPQTVRSGSVILMDCGCTVHGYQSDISRTWVFGDADARQRKVWSTVRRGQEIALETARRGVAAGAIDDAVRRYYQREGWGPGYRLPGLPHRTGHGIGLDGHEAAYLVHGDSTPLQPGMCFSDEPGLYIPGEFGVRLEDCWHMTETGPVLFTQLASSIDDPI